jgi:CHRD domain
MLDSESSRSLSKIEMSGVFQRLRTASLVICTIAATSFAAPLTSEAATLIFGAVLGDTENPATGSAGTGSALVTINNDSMTVDVSFSGLGSGTTASHIHCCVASPGNVMVATTTPTFPGFPLGVTSGSYNMTFDMTLATSYNPAFITAHGGSAASAEAFLFAGMIAGNAYLNIHTTQFGGGEIRGFLAPVPLPTALPLFATGLGVLGLLGWRRKRKVAA